MAKVKGWMASKGVPPSQGAGMDGKGEGVDGIKRCAPSQGAGMDGKGKGTCRVRSGSDSGPVGSGNVNGAKKLIAKSIEEPGHVRWLCR